MSASPAREPVIDRLMCEQSADMHRCDQHFEGQAGIGAHRNLATIAGAFDDLLRSPGGLSVGAAQAMAKPDHVAAAADVTLCAPLQPPSIRDCLGFLQHLRNCAEPAGLTIDHRYGQVPAFYFTNPAAVLGPPTTSPSSPDPSSSTTNWRSARSSGNRAATSLPARPANTSPATPSSATGAHAICRSTNSPWEPDRRRAKTAP